MIRPASITQVALLRDYGVPVDVAWRMTYDEAAAEIAKHQAQRREARQ